MLYDYFVAADDTMAEQTYTELDGGRCAGYPELVVKRADPHDLLPVEASLTGRTAEEVEADPQRCRDIGEFDEFEELECAVVALSGSFRDALATADDDALRAAVAAFAEQDELGETDGLLPFLKELAVLANGAVTHRHQLCCRIVW
ncbi:hypothetical protein [Amycolatopsis sp. La24]|uniref:hypothetical protein n=1 Tax=Amycolatopsis sp. La24 TaxID=3028304 RepID=UPI0023B0E594|nr:hypothetical protein [Amycolatopsis sp. La24]